LHPRPETDHRPRRHQRKDEAKDRGLGFRFGFPFRLNLLERLISHADGGGVGGRDLLEGILPDGNLLPIIFVDRVEHLVAVVAKRAVISDAGVSLSVKSRSRERSRSCGGSDPRWQEWLDQIYGQLRHAVLLRFRWFNRSFCLNLSVDTYVHRSDDMRNARKQIDATCFAREGASIGSAATCFLSR